jgi:hypothetical protein
MKKTLTILTVIVVFGLGSLVILTSAPKSRRYPLIFLGFTPTNGGVDAIFSVKVPMGTTTSWRMQEVCRWEAGAWQSWARTNPPQLNLGMDPITRAILVAVPVETTNVPSRVVIRLDERPSDVGGILSQPLAWWWRIKGDTPPKARTLFITNETVVGSAPQ